jgi:hypothetical protein
MDQSDSRVIFDEIGLVEARIRARGLWTQFVTVVAAFLPLGFFAFAAYRWYHEQPIQPMVTIGAVIMGVGVVALLVLGVIDELGRKRIRSLVKDLDLKEALDEPVRDRERVLEFVIRVDDSGARAELSESVVLGGRVLLVCVCAVVLGMIGFGARMMFLYQFTTGEIVFMSVGAVVYAIVMGTAAATAINPRSWRYESARGVLVSRWLNWRLRWREREIEIDRVAGVFVSRIKYGAELDDGTEVRLPLPAPVLVRQNGREHPLAELHMVQCYRLGSAMGLGKFFSSSDGSG